MAEAAHPVQPMTELPPIISQRREQFQSSFLSVSHDSSRFPSLCSSSSDSLSNGLLSPSSGASVLSPSPRNGSSAVASSVLAAPSCMASEEAPEKCILATKECDTDSRADFDTPIPSDLVPLLAAFIEDADTFLAIAFTCREWMHALGLAVLNREYRDQRQALSVSLPAGHKLQESSPASPLFSFFSFPNYEVDTSERNPKAVHQGMVRTPTDIEKKTSFPQPDDGSFDHVARPLTYCFLCSSAGSFPSPQSCRFSAGSSASPSPCRTCCSSSFLRCPCSSVEKSVSRSLLPIQAMRHISANVLLLLPCFSNLKSLSLSVQALSPSLIFLISSVCPQLSALTLETPRRLTSTSILSLCQQISRLKRLELCTPRKVSRLPSSSSPVSSPSAVASSSSSARASRSSSSCCSPEIFVSVSCQTVRQKPAEVVPRLGADTRRREGNQDEKGGRKETFPDEKRPLSGKREPQTNPLFLFFRAKSLSRQTAGKNGDASRKDRGNSAVEPSRSSEETVEKPGEAEGHQLEAAAETKMKALSGEPPQTRKADAIHRKDNEVTTEDSQQNLVYRRRVVHRIWRRENQEGGSKRNQSEVVGGTSQGLSSPSSSAVPPSSYLPSSSSSSFSSRSSPSPESSSCSISFSTSQFSRESPFFSSSLAASRSVPLPGSHAQSASDQGRERQTSCTIRRYLKLWTEIVHISESWEVCS
ncbi:hypothetical protein TGRUB_211650 [Toxoplasma gondii RUB]|uniref:Uncharacterized protein n=1 Tax=Toxoplasma gondii RUB TaxID=935652 RepID=A0A086LMH4_TOXGO|nr:hypothetical protein TGRUB_211650 [Toxoplasma gondii RUB]